jgi:hypothetical protein
MVVRTGSPPMPRWAIIASYLRDFGLASVCAGSVPRGWPGPLRNRSQHNCPNRLKPERVQARLEVAPDDLKRFIMFEEGLVNLGEAFQDLGMSRSSLAHLDEGADYVQAHGHSLGTVGDVASTD